ncbi:hypothetical protein [Peterkaempfera sp. SMS 1(5)a]
MNIVRSGGVMSRLRLDETVLMLEDGQRTADRLAGAVVEPDCGGEGQDAPGGTDGDTLEGPCAVLFEVKLLFEAVVDRIDQWAHRRAYLSSRTDHRGPRHVYAAPRQNPLV